MLTYIEGDLFNSPAQVLVNTVNTVGVMGKGIALEFKKRYPAMFEAYKKQCDKQSLVIGKLMLWYAADHWILQFPTKEHWRSPSKLEYIEKGLMTFVQKYADYNITSIAFPKLGCGNGELNWSEVKLLMEKYLGNLPIDVYIYLGKSDKSKPEHKRQKEMSEWMKENAKDLSFTGVKDSIIYNTSIAPQLLLVDDNEWKVSWKNNENLIFESGEQTIEIEEKKVHMIWDYICKKRIFGKQNDIQVDMFFNYLMSEGYLQEIKIQNNDGTNLYSGYQLELGKGRAFLVRGN